MTTTTPPTVMLEDMTLRDFFAAQALTAIDFSDWEGEDLSARVARQAFRLADAMLEARNRDPD